MGVTGLWKLIDQSGKPVPLDTLENKILAVDISIWLHQVVKGFQDSNGATLPNAHLLGLFHRLCKLMFYRIRPVFVFDGGVPSLKRETIAKRARNKSKYQNEADKLQQLLLEALAKEKVVQQALGPSTSSLISPRKGPQKSTNNEEENDMFKLPPMVEIPKDDSLTDISEGDGSFEEKHRIHYNHNLQAIDVKSSHFQSLPADIRHEILSDIKETRKQSSWGRLHELPVESQSFSNFQMSRLLKRRQVQVSLEEAEKEMGGKGLSMAELENLLSEEGVVDPDIATERIASSDHIRFLHVRDLTKAIKKETDENVKQERLNAIKEEEENDNKEKLKEEIKKENDSLTEEDSDIQAAIHMSLGCDIDLQKAIQLSLGGAIDADNESDEENDTVKLTTQQKKAFGSTANSLARHYMVEYGGMNDDEVSDLVKINETMNETREFKYNDDSILIGKSVDINVPSTSSASSMQGKEILQNIKFTKEKSSNRFESSSDEDEDEISSGADSDFIEVPNIEEDEIDDVFLARAKLPLPGPFIMNQPPVRVPIGSEPKNLSLTPTKIEVVINPGHMYNADDDMFADIFAKSNEKMNIKEDSEQNGSIKNMKADESEIEKNGVIEIEDSPIKSPKESFTSKSPELQLESSETIENNGDTVETEPVKKLSDSKILNILSELDNEKISISKLSLDDLLNTKPDELTQTETQSSKNFEFLEKLKENEKVSSELEEKLLTPTKIPQPFFVKKTPPSSKKKSPGIAKAGNDLTPSKAAKSLTDVFESLPSTSAKPISEKESIAMAANILREKKSKEELQDIAEQMNQDRRNLITDINKKDRLGVSITDQMSTECMDLLRLFGIPYIVAPMEAEAQCAYLNEINLTEGTITDDSDIWLFGGQTVYKNFFDQNKTVLEFRSDNIQKLFHLDRDKLIQLSFLVGSDYTQGIHGIGAVTALEVLSIFPPTPEKDGETTHIVSILSSLRKFRDWWHNKTVGQRATTLRNKLKNITFTEDFPNTRVVEAYLFPTVNEDREKFSWGVPELESLREYAKKTFGWTNKRTDEMVLPVIKKLNEKKSQQSIQNYFKITGATSRQDLKVSKRVRAALEQMSADPDAPIADDILEKKKPKRKPSKKSSEKNVTDESTADKPKPKRGRKRKSNTETELNSEKQQSNTDAEPSTSKVVSVSAGAKKVVLPDPNEPIPQREKDKKIMQNNRAKAIEVLKKMKAGKK